jgi:Zn-dependent protease
LLFIIALALTSLMLFALRGGFSPLPAQAPRHAARGQGIDHAMAHRLPHLPSVILAAAATLLTATVFGAGIGLSMLIAMALHELGHIAGARVADLMLTRADRLHPPGIAPAQRRSDTRAFFVTFCGPALGLAPMLVAYGAAELMWQVQPDTAAALWTFAGVTAAFNAFFLLPFYPLDGGRCVALMARAIAPELSRVAALALSALLGSLALWQGSTGLAVLAAFGVFGAVLQGPPARCDTAPMRLGTVALAQVAYLAALLCYLSGGAWLILDLLG